MSRITLGTMGALKIERDGDSVVVTGLAFRTGGGRKIMFRKFAEQAFPDSIVEDVGCETWITPGDARVVLVVEDFLNGN